MPRIFDNKQSNLLDALKDNLKVASKADICVGYFRLRGWEQLMNEVDQFAGGDGACCRLLIGMERPPEEIMRGLQSALKTPEGIDGKFLREQKQKAVRHFKEQIEFGLPTARAQSTFRRLAKQLREKKLFAKLFLRYPMHAKLYLIDRPDQITPKVGYLGSSNLTLSGLSQQGELNIDVVDQDAVAKLQEWFDDKWQDTHSLDISDELANLLESSWAGEEVQAIENLPYLIYLKIAYHLSEDARLGETEFKLPDNLKDVLLDFQKAAVQLSARQLYKHGGVLLGDVVGLGKTLMATALARVFQEADNSRTLIICPPKIAPLWRWHMDQYELNGHILSLGKVSSLGDLPRYKTLIIDESHNLRNRGSKRYQDIKEYIDLAEPRVILLTATPFNKQFEDISSQIRLFVDEDTPLPVKPERLLQSWASQGKSEADFIGKHDISPRSIRAFEESEFPEDWRDLMRLFMVRRTRSFIIRNYATLDDQQNRYYVMLNGRRNYFPRRQPKTIRFDLNEGDPNDQYARLYSEKVAQIIENLALPRYGLSLYLKPDALQLTSSPSEEEQLKKLNKAGKRLIGFCRTNLFKRLESSGSSFLQSINRHILRNLVFVHALETGQPLPIGTQEATIQDTTLNDADLEVFQTEEDTYADMQEDEVAVLELEDAQAALNRAYTNYRQQAKLVYDQYRNNYERRFKWLDTKFFIEDLKESLMRDAQELIRLMEEAGDWIPDKDEKLNKLHNLIEKQHGTDKLLIFTQFADTAGYLLEQLRARGVHNLEAATSGSGNPTVLTKRFSPNSNGGLPENESALRVLIATDVLSEGQNLQDAHIVVNYDLPWAIIRLIQRVGRVDRIGQNSDTIFVYSFMPAEGVEKIIRLRQRLSERLSTNQEVVGSDESLMGEPIANDKLLELFTENAKALEEDGTDIDIDLTSLALQVWNSATEDAREQAKNLPAVVYGTRAQPHAPDNPNGVISYIRLQRSNEQSDLLVRVDKEGNLTAQSLSSLFLSVACEPSTRNINPPIENHFELVKKTVEWALQESPMTGRLGMKRAIRRRVYERLKGYIDQQRHMRPLDLLSQERLEEAERLMEEILRSPLKEKARDILSTHLKSGVTDIDLIQILMNLREEERLCQEYQSDENVEPHIVCSLGLKEVVL